MNIRHFKCLMGRTAALLILWTAFQPVCGQTDEYLHTGLPVCYVDYDPTATITKTDKISAEMTLCTPGDTLRSEVKLSGRGNYTWTLAKKPYNLKLDKKASLLGMPAGKKFALMANQCDPSMCRIAVGFEAGRWVGFEWPLQGRYVELVMNGRHQGCYFLAERVSQSTVKVNKDYGYILEYKYADQIAEGSVNFTTDREKYILEFKDPDTPDKDGEMYSHAVRTMNTFEEAVFADDHLTRRRWEPLVDMDNFVKWYYWKNLLQMDECNRYYVVEDLRKDTPLKMGPLWDFDWTIGMDYHGEHYNDQYMRNKLYFAPMADDSVFLARVARFHQDHRQQIETRVTAVYDSLATLLHTSVQLNEQLWGPYRTTPLDWDHEIETDRSYLLATLNYLDRELGPYLDAAAITDVHDRQTDTNGKFLIHGRLYIRRGAALYDCQGRRQRLSQLVEENER